MKRRVRDHTLGRLARVCGGAGLVLFVSARAEAAPLSATIRVERAETAQDCPDGAALTSRVQAILQRDLSTPSANEEQLEVAVQFSRVREAYVAHVRSLGPKPGQRDLRDRGTNCGALAEAVSVAIALLLDKELAQRAQGQGQSGTSAPDGTSTEASATNRETPTKKPATPPAPDAEASEAERERSHAGQTLPLELRLSLEGGVASGFVGQTTALLAENAGLRLAQHWTLDLGFNAVLPGNTNFGVGKVRSELLFGSARACYTFGERYSIGPCAQFGLGRLHGVGIGYSNVGSQNLLWSALGASLVAEGPVWGRVFWGLSASAWWPTRRSTFSVENVGIAWESRRFAGSAALRLGLRLW